MADQAIVLRLREDLARRVRQLVESESAAYQSIQEFITTAIENQLHLEEPSHVAEAASGYEGGAAELLAIPSGSPRTAETVSAADTPLFVLTNRLSPVKIAARVLANLAEAGEWPPVPDFQRRAAMAARALGLQLKSEGAVIEHGGTKRWVGFPIGSDVELSLARFITSFTLWADGAQSGGPMATLGLAGVDAGRAVLTDSGWRLALAPSPLLREAPGGTLSDEEGALFRAAVASSTAERPEVELFVEIVRSTQGSQGAIDRKLRAARPEWSENRTAAHRAAMCGRLGEIGVLDVEGRGPRGRVLLRDAAADLV